ncbi:hypothetical protein F5878DRAFT_665845 [Lentinula raphanica]|uniref:Uncharacterized protein n=1 Tax=Lentinula raphanica TaxID=153919 RepID=A0AA38NYX3_9AGAR|nr:hypothetical protein F5878DRAFT_665845 [Lentinula raphanica]
MPSTAPTYNDNPTFAGSIPRGFEGTGYGKALVGLRLTFDRENNTDYLKDLGRCMNPRTPDNIHSYTVMTGGQRATRGEMSRITRRFCGTKECRNPDRLWGPPCNFQHIPVLIRDRRKLAVQYAFWLECAGKQTLASNIRKHFLNDGDMEREVRSSPAGPQVHHDEQEVQSSPLRAPKRKSDTQDSDAQKSVAKRARLSMAVAKKPQSIYISDSESSDSEVEIVDVKLVGDRLLSTQPTASSSAGPSGIHRPSGRYAIGSSAKDRVFTHEDLISACKHLEEKVTEVLVDDGLKAAVQSLKATLDIFV